MFIVMISKGFPVASPAPHNLKFPQKVAPVAGPTIMLLPAGRKFGRKTQMGTILMRAGRFWTNFRDYFPQKRRE
jgi:hypothetical protein